MEFWVPTIQTAVISPNPAEANGSVVLEVTVTEVLTILDPEQLCSGEIYSGEGY